MNSVSALSRIDSIERINLYVAGVLCAGSLFFASLSVTVGVGVGAAIVVVNFRWVRRLIERAMTKGTRGKRTLYGEYGLKLLLFLAIPCGVIYYRKFLLDLDPLAFIVGLSTVFISVLVEGVRGIFRQTR